MKKINWLVFGAIIFGSTGCPAPGNCGKGALRFENPPILLGTSYNSPAFLYNNGAGLAVSVGPIVWVNGTSYNGHSEILNTPPHPFGTNQVIRMNNDVLNFDLTQNTLHAEFEYLDQGGTINLSAHGSGGMYIGNMSAMPVNMIINGVSVTKTNVQNILNAQGVKVAEKGMILLKSNTDIGGMVIGGQELFLDNFCFN